MIAIPLSSRCNNRLRSDVRRHGCLIMILALLASASREVAAEQDPQWRVPINDKIRWMTLAPTGVIIINTPKRLIAINPQDGSLLWEQPQLGKLSPSDVELIPLSPFAVINIPSGRLSKRPELAVIDLTDGHSRWTSETLGIDKSHGQFLLSEINTLLLYGRDTKTHQPVMVAVDLATDKVRWSLPMFFGGNREPQMFPIHSLIAGDQKPDRDGLVGNQPPVVSPDGSLLFLMSEQKGLRSLDPTNGTLKWISPLPTEPVPAVADGYAPLAIDPGRTMVAIPHKQSLQAVELSSGKPLWLKAIRLPGIPRQLHWTPHGLVVMGSPTDKEPRRGFLSLLDPSTGRPVWKKKWLRIPKEISNPLITDQDVTILVKNRLFRYDLKAGTASRSTKLPISAKRSTVVLHKLDNRYLLTDDSRVVSIDATGKVTYAQRYGGLTEKRPTILNPSYGETFRQADGAQLEFLKTWPAITNRIENARRTKRYIYRYGSASIEKRRVKGIVQIDLDNGLAVDAVALKKNRLAVLDDIDGWVVATSSDKELLGYPLVLEKTSASESETLVTPAPSSVPPDSAKSNAMSVLSTAPPTNETAGSAAASPSEPQAPEAKE